MFERLFRDPGGSFFLFGPRGTGKSTWVKEHLPGALVVDLLRPDVLRRFSARPERLRELVLGHPRHRVVVIDEIQKVPALLDAVHGLIEERTRHRFILTGSSSRKLKRTGVDLLAGRAAVETMHPLMAAEMGAAFQLEDAVRRGLLPVVVSARRPAAALDSYVSLYVREEVQMEGLVRRVGDFARFLEVASFSHGGVLNVSNVARECEVGRKAVEAYVEILVDLLLAFRLPVFERRARRAVTQHPKLYFADAGIFRSLRPAGPLDRPAEIEGAALEGLVAQHLRAWIAYGHKRLELFFWRTPSGTEVDFVVYGEGGFWAIEVKNAAEVRSGDLRSLLAFRADYPECRPVLIHRGTERTERNGVACVPCADFLRALRPEGDVV